MTTLSKLAGTLIEVASACGCFHVARSCFASSVWVLTYHGFVDNAERRTGRYGYLFRNSIPIGEFAKHLAFIRRSVGLLTPDEFLAIVHGDRPATQRGVLITIDDGLSSAIDLALPVLARHGAKAVLLVPSFGIDEVSRGNRWTQWHEDLASRLLTDAAALGSLWPDLCRIAGALPKEMGSHIEDNIVAIQQAGLLLAPSTLDSFVRTIADILRRQPEPRALEYRGPGSSVLQVTTWSALAEAGRLGMEIGSHSATHARMAALNHEQLNAEIVGSKATIEAHLGRPCRYFSVPYGQDRDCHPRQDHLLQAAGYEAAFTQVRAPASQAEPFRLGRVDIPASCTVGKLNFSLSIPWVK